MSATQTETGSQPTTNGKPARKARAKGKRRIVGKPTSQFAGQHASLPQPTAIRAAAMKERALTNSIAQGFAAELLTAGPSWSADYQKQFLAGLTAVLPAVCTPKESRLQKAA